VLGQPQMIGAVGEHERDENVERRLLGHPDERRAQDLPRLFLDDLPDRPADDRILLLELVERGALQDTQPHVQPDADQDDAGQERHPPAPAVERGPGHAAEQLEHAGGQQQPDRHPHLGPAGHESAPVLLAPFHGQQYRAAPLAAHTDALRDAQDDHQDGRGGADGGVGGQQAHEERRDPHQQQRGDQGCFAADPVAVVAEDHRPDRPGGEPDELGAERQQDPGIGAVSREEHLREHQRRGGAVQEEVIPLDRGPDGARDYRPQPLGPDRRIGHGVSRHAGATPPSSAGKPLSTVTDSTSCFAQLPAAPAPSASRSVAPSTASSNRDGALRTSRRGMSSSAIMAITAQPTRYQLMKVLEPVELRIAAAMSGAGPPAMTEASWYPSPAPLYRTFGPKDSAISAACGPYCMSWKNSDSTMASRTSPATLVLSRPK